MGQSHTRLTGTKPRGYNNSAYLVERVRYNRYEANLAAKAHSAEARTWLYEADELEGGAEGPQSPPSQGALAPDCRLRLGRLCVECVSCQTRIRGAGSFAARGAFCVLLAAYSVHRAFDLVSLH